MLSPLSMLAVVEVPQLGPLVLRIPLVEPVAERVDALLGARLLLVAARAAERGVEAAGGRAPAAAPASSSRPCTSCCRPSNGLSACASGAAVGVDDQLEPVLGGRTRRGTRSSRGTSSVVSTCSSGNGSRPGWNAFMARRTMHRRVLADRVEHHRVLELGRHLADDVDALGLELPEVGEAVSAHCRRTARRAAVLEGPDGSWNGITGSTPGAGPRRDGHRPAAAGAIPHPQVHSGNNTGFASAVRARLRHCGGLSPCLRPRSIPATAPPARRPCSHAGPMPRPRPRSRARSTPGRRTCSPPRRRRPCCACSTGSTRRSRAS